MARSRLALVLFILAVSLTSAQEPVFADRKLSEWMRDLDDADSLVREEAMEVLGKLGPAGKPALAKLEALVKNSNEPLARRAALTLWKIDGRVSPAREMYQAFEKSAYGIHRVHAVQTLRQLGVPSKDLAPRVVELLLDPDYNIYNPAMALLQQLGTDSIPALSAALPKARGESRYRLLNHITSLGALARPMVPVIQGMLKDPDPRTSMAAVRTLWSLNIDRQDLAKLVVEISKGAHVASRLEAIQFSLSVTPKIKELEPVLQLALKENNQDSRCRAVLALWELDRTSLKGNLKVLIDTLKDGVRTGAWYSAVQAISTIGPDAKEALPTLVDALNSPEGLGYSYTLIPAIGRMGPDAVDPLVKNLATTNVQLQQPSRQALMSIGPSAIPKLLTHLKSDDKRVVAEVLTILAAYGNVGQEAVPKLAELIKESDPAVRMRALEVVAQIGPAAGDAVKHLVEFIGSRKPAEHGETAAAARALGSIGPAAKQARGTLLDLLKHEQVNVRVDAAEALTRVDTDAVDQVVPVLHAILKNKTAGVNVTTIAGVLCQTRTGLADSMTLLQEWLKANSGVRAQVASMLSVTPLPIKEAAPLLRELVNDASQPVKNEAALALARLGQDVPTILPVLQTMARQNVYPWRDRALTALTDLGPAAKDALPELLDMWRGNPAIDLQCRLAEAILAIDRNKGKPIMEWLRTSMTGGTPYTRLMVLRVLAKFDSKNSEVLTGLRNAGRELPATYVPQLYDAFGRLGPAANDVVPELKQALKDTNLLNRVSAAAALWSIEGKAGEVVPVLQAALAEIDPMPVGAIYQRPPRQGAAAAAKALGLVGPAAKPALDALRVAAGLGDATLRNNALTAIAQINAHAANGTKP